MINNLSHYKQIPQAKLEFRVKILLLLMAVLSVLFVLFFSKSMHCSQVTSFKIAIFDMKPYIEEDYSMIYDPKFAFKLRTYLTICLFTFLFYPSLAGFLWITSKLKAGAFILFWFLICFIQIINTFLPENIIGERFQALNFYSLFFIFLISTPLVIYVEIKNHPILHKLDYVILKLNVSEKP